MRKPLSEATLRKHASKLLDLYVELWEDKYQKDIVINSHKNSWGFKSMVKDLGVARGEEVIRYYFETNRVGHPLDHLLYNYDRLHKILLEKAEDAVKRKQYREETRQRVKEMEERGYN